MRLATHPRPPRPHAAGFTLVELLVVVAIIGLLIAMLLPSLNAARNAARNSICVSNLRQMSIGQLNYATDRKEFTFWTRMWNNDFAYFKSSGSDAAGVDARLWLLQLMGNTNYKIFYCPRGRISADDPIDGWNHPVTADPSIVRLSYGLVSMREPTPYEMTISTVYTKPMVYADLPAPTYAAPSTGNRPKKLSAIASPERIAVATDAQRAYFSYAAGFSYPGYKPTPWSQYWGDYVYPHRRGDDSWDGNTASFFDGHAGFVKFENLGTISTTPSPGAKYRMGFGGAYIDMPYWW